jgi:DNA-binding CsgD family transcriptional regulator
MYNSIEFFTGPDNKECFYKIEEQPESRILTPEDTDIINQLLGRIEIDYPQAYEALHKLYGAMAFHKFKMASRFIRCNLGSYDNKIDSQADGILNFEFIPCPMRGECAHEKVICFPKYNTTLSRREMEVMELICDNLTDEEIANKLFISKFTAERHRKNILSKLHVHNKQGISDFARKNNMI